MQNHRPILIHATAVALPVAGDWAGVLLRGPSGSGKSDLALRMIDQGARLVADDQTELSQGTDGLTISAPARLTGRIEVRGLGLIPVPAVERVPLVLIADLVPPAEIDRLPLPRFVNLAGTSVAAVRLAPFEASVTAKLRLAAQAAVAGAIGALDGMAVS